MRPLSLNLARRPFVNVRPVLRTAVFFWAIGAVLLGVNLFLYWRHFSGEGRSDRVLENIAGRIASERDATARLETELAGFELDRQNELVLFLNQKIAARTFAWSALFDDLAEVLPADVQLERVAPKFGRQRAVGGRRQDLDLGVVSLSLNGRAKSPRDMLEFVDALFAHPRFREPSPTSESRTQDSTEPSFSMTVLYLPRPAEPAPSEAEPAPAPQETTPAAAVEGEAP